MEIIGLIAGLMALVWTAVLVRKGGLLAGCLLVVFVGACLGHAFFHHSVLTLDRVLLAALFGYYLIQRRWSPDKSNPLTVPDVLLVILLVVLAVNTFSHDWRINEKQPASRFLFLYLMPAVMYWLGRECKIRQQQARWLMFSFSIFGVYLALTAVAELRGWTPLVMPRYVISNEFEEFLGRARGPFLNPSANGIYMTTALACLLMYWPRTSGLKRVGLEVGALIISVGCFATLTRCVWLGFVLGLIALTWLCCPKRVRLGLLILFLCVSTLGVTLSWNRLVAFKRDKDVPASQMAESARLRPMLAAVAWQMFQQRPITGYGLGQYTHSDDEFIAARRVDMPLDRVRPYHQHNIILSLATETGLLGTLPFLALIASWAVAAHQLWRSDGTPLEVRQLGLVYLVTLVNFTANGMFQDVTIIPTVNLLLFFLGGTTMAAISATDVSERWVWRRFLSRNAIRQRPVYGSRQAAAGGK